MKKSIQIFLMLICFSAISLSAQKKGPESIIPVSQKNGIYRITDAKKLNFTFKDNGFSAWLKKQKPPRYFYESSLEIINLQYVKEWNKRADNPDYNATLYTQNIDYQLHSKVHYGIEINYYLYMYFKYFEKKYQVILKRH